MKKKTQLEVKQENDVKESLCYFCCSEVASWGMQGSELGTELGEHDLRMYMKSAERTKQKAPSMQHWRLPQQTSNSIFGLAIFSSFCIVF